MNIRKEVAAATAVVNYDLIQTELNNRLPYARILDEVALVGSAAAADTVVEVMVNGKSVGMFENTATGLAIDKSRDVKIIDEYVPANALIQAFVRDAASTNPVCIYLGFSKPKSSGRRTFRRRTGARRVGARAPRIGGMY